MITASQLWYICTTYPESVYRASEEVIETMFINYCKKSIGEDYKSIWENRAIIVNRICKSDRS